MQTNSYLTDDEARALYSTAEAIEPDAAHDFDHVARVTRLAVQIAGAEGADVEVVRLAALLHDVPLAATARGAHHLAAAAYAGELLPRRGLEPQRVANVVHCIAAHRFRDRTVTPATLEAKCLYDADKLDSIGAIGVARAFAFGGAYGSRLWSEPWPDAPPDDAKPLGANYTPVHEFVYKLQRIADTLHTASARRIAAQRHRFMCAFYDQLDAEMLGVA
jgi:uncharacterized protein